MEIKDRIEDLYQEWLMFNYPKEIKGKDDLIDKMCEGYKYDEFIKLVKESL